MLDLVAVPACHPGRAAGPEIRHVADHRPAVAGQPLAVAGGQVVLPLRDGDVGVDVDLALAEHVGHVRRLLAAVLRIGLPREHRAAQAACLRARFGGRQGARAEHHQRFRPLRMQQQQRGKDPGIAVPEHVAGVAGRHAAGSGRPGGVGGGVGQQVVKVGVDDLLRLRIAVDADVRCPQFAPGIAVRVEQALEAGRARGRGQRAILLRIATPARARQRDEFGEGVGLSPAHCRGEVQRQPIAAPVYPQLGGLQARGQVDRGRLGHRQALLGVAVQPQRTVAGVAIGGGDVRVAVVPERGTVGRGRRDRFELQVVCRHRLLHFIAAQAGQRETRLMRRPQVQRERQLYLAVELRRDRQPGRGEMRRGLTDQARHLDARGPAMVEVAVARGERALVHIQLLLVVLEHGRVQRGLVEPEVAGRRVARAVVDLAPAGHRGRACDVARRVVHERDQVGEVALGAARRGQRRQVAVAELAGKVAGEVLRGGRQQEAGIGRGARADGTAKADDDQCRKGPPSTGCTLHLDLHGLAGRRRPHPVHPGAAWWRCFRSPCGSASPCRRRRDRYGCRSACRGR